MMLTRMTTGLLCLIMSSLAGPALAEDDILNVDVEEIMSVYNDNELAGDQRFKGKKIRVSGVIGRITSSHDGRPYVMLSTPMHIRGMLYCYFSSDFTPELVKLKKGQKLTSTCTVKGVRFSDSVELENCIID